MKTTAYLKAKELLFSVSTENGFLASKSDISNYKRIWARDGVICGLATLLDGDKKLINTFKETLITLSEYQHELGNIPSNVYFKKDKVQLSFGGLCGRVDTISWYIIGICNYVWFTRDQDFFETQIPHIKKGFSLLEAWEFNHKHLVYIPTSGNWADEYAIEGYVFYDQLLRLWAMQCFEKLNPSPKLRKKIKAIRQTVETNYCNEKKFETSYHFKALKKTTKKPYWLASFSPSGYNIKYDAFANALGILLGIGSIKKQENVVEYTLNLKERLSLDLLPSFWPVITKKDSEWQGLILNNTYEFRNRPYEFHNGGTWAIINAFFGMALLKANKYDEAKITLYNINKLNKQSAIKGDEWGFYENFNTKTAQPIGVVACAWSAAATIILDKAIDGKSLFFE